ncbi:MAG: B12-binding domain-containing radical SAM protein, partial [Deltaproteobacteria bacterium]|nr:B12-binding domain-containing radical SAM protein [Deltaproteobacteria bacterium]
MRGRPVETVQLIFPPSSSVGHYEPMVTTPMGLAYLGAVLRERGYRVWGLDALAEAPYQVEQLGEGVVRYGLTPRQIVDRVRRRRPHVVGLSCLYSNQWPAVRAIAAGVKRLDPEILVVAGGAHPTALPERCLRDSELDLIVLGEGERTFPEALRRIAAGRPLDDLGGVAWREGDDVRVNQGGELIEDLDSLPLPAHDLFPPERYFELALPMGYTLRSRRSLPVITSRGCPMRCTFCASTRFWGKRLRARSPEAVLAELEWLVSRYGVEDVKFQDDNLTARRGRARRLFEGMARARFRLGWSTPNGVAIWTLDDELLRLMKRAGCYELTLS